MVKDFDVKKCISYIREKTIMRQFRNKITKEIFKVKDTEEKILKALEFNEGFEELYEI